MEIHKLHSFSPNSKWKFISLAGSTFLVNGDETNKFHEIICRLKCLEKASCEGKVDDVELFVTKYGYLFKFYDDLYEISKVFEIDLIRLSDYDYKNDDVLLVLTEGKNQMTLVSFWHDTKTDSETYQELYSISLSLLPSVKTFANFMERITFIKGFFYFKNGSGDRLLLRFNSEKVNAYEIPEHSKFYIDKMYEKYMYVRFDNTIIDIITFKLYDISNAINLLGNRIDKYSFAIFNLSNPDIDNDIDFIFWYEGKNVFKPELVSTGKFTEVNGFLYCYSRKQFIFCDSVNQKEPECHTFLLYDYSVPNIIKRAFGYQLFYLDSEFNISYQELEPNIQLLTSLIVNKNGHKWNRIIFTNCTQDTVFENKSTIIVKNSVFLSNVLTCSTLGQIVYTDSANDAIRFILSKQFDKRIALKTILSSVSSGRIVFYLFLDDCCTLETPLSEFGRYTLFVPKQPDIINYELSFDAFKKFILSRNTEGSAWYDHLILKCTCKYDGEDDTIYIDATDAELISLESIINDAFKGE